MSGGTSAGNIVTEVPGTYAARTWRSVVKVDAYGVIVDAQLASIIGANWFNNVDDNLGQLNAWLNGTGKAALIKATAIEVDGLDVDNGISVDDIEVSNDLTVFGDAQIVGTLELGVLDATTIGGTTANISGTLTAGAIIAGTGVIADATADANDLVVGAIGAVDYGITILSTSVAKVAFTDVANTPVGYLAYVHTGDTLNFGTAGATRLSLSATTLAPGIDGAVTLGSGSLKYANAHLTDVMVYSGMTIGDATGGPNVVLNRDTGSQSNILFKSEGVTEFHLRHEANFIGIGRYTGGVFQSAIQFDQPVGDLYIPRDVYMTTGDLEMSGASAQIRMGDGTSTPTISLTGASGGVINFKNSLNNRAFEISADTVFAIDRYSAGVLSDSVTYNASGIVTIPTSLVVGSNSINSPSFTLSKTDVGTSSLNFMANTVTRWAWMLDSSEDLLLVRYSAGGATLSTSTFSNSTGALTFPHDVSLPGSTRTLTVGDGSGASTVVLNKSFGTSASIELQDTGTTRWIVRCNNVESLLFDRYNSGGVLQDTTTVSATDGSWSFPAGIGVSGQTRRLTSGSGAPAAGATNGDIYWRIDGTISTTLYIRIAGAWVAAVLT